MGLYRKHRMAALHTVEKISVAGFLAMAESDQWMELVDGEVIVTPKPSSDHQAIVPYLAFLIHSRIGRTGRLLVEKEFIVHNPDGREQVRCPDLLYVRESNSSLVKADAVEGAVDLTVEVLSKGTAEIDRITKRDEYRASGVSEYWIVDMEDRAVMVHDFRADTHIVYPSGEAFVSRILDELGFEARFEISEIFSVLD